MAEIVPNPSPKKALIALTVTVLLVLVVPSPDRWKLASAFAGVLLGNQVGALLDAISKKFRVIGFLILVWSAYSLATGRMEISQATHVNLAAFLWGYGFLSCFPQRQMALFILEFDK